MKHNVVAPSVGESITEVSILKWHKQSGQAVKNGDLLLEIESDKATVEIVAETGGVLTVLKPEGERIPIGELIGLIDDAATASAGAGAQAPQPGSAAQASPKPIPPAPPQVGRTPPAAAQGVMSPAVRKAATEQGVDVSQIAGTGKDGRVTKGDLLGAPAQSATPHTAPGYGSQPASTVPAAPTPLAQAAPKPQTADKPGDRRVPMTMLRARIAERLVQAQHTAAILTTFNEADMSAVMSIRNQHKDAFKARNGVPLSFMSFFALATIEALKAVPEVNAYIDGRDTIYHDYVDLGIAVGTERGLVVPIVRGADKLGMLGIEKRVAELAVKARDSKLSIADMSGGTFTISNGGVYGSLLSTPILNPPQSGILGMHKIMERPIVVSGKIEARPMMYLALSYDHRIVDGKGAVTFLVKLKECIENPAEHLPLEL